MGASFSGNLRAIDHGSCMIQLWTITFKPTFYGPSPEGHASVRGRDKLHELGHEGEEVVSSVVNSLLVAGPHVALLPRDLARVHGVIGHDRRADEHGRFPVGIYERGLARPVDPGERGRTMGPR
jgi:hypothetical protein